MRFFAFIGNLMYNKQQKNKAGKEMKKLIKSLLLLSAIMWLASCAITYAHREKSPEAFDKDVKDCQVKAEAKNPIFYGSLCRLTKQCLEEEKGWYRVH